jgi:nucleotide-binding universal stress UspA family protein
MATIEKTLIPIDFSELSQEALDYAQMLSATTGTQLELLHVWEPPSAALPVPGTAGHVPLPRSQEALMSQTMAQTREAAEQILNDMAAKVPSLHRDSVHAHVLSGKPAEAICDFAAQQDCDLIVVGTHQRRPISQLLLGSVVQRVLRHAPCPVLVVPQKFAAEELKSVPQREQGSRAPAPQAGAA